MKAYALFCLLTWAIASVSAYDLYGGYERIIYYNAYRMDWAKSGGDAKRLTIANACAKAGKPCDLLDFVQYINQDGKKPVLNMRGAPAGWDPVNMHPDHVDWTAKALRDAGATGIYEPNKIYKGVSRNNVDGLFRKVGEFIVGSQDADGVSEDAFKCAKKAILVWSDLRTWAQGLAFQDYLERLYPGAGKLVSKDNPVGGSGETVKTIDLEESIMKLRKQPGMAKYKMNTDVYAFQVADPGHNEKVILAKEVKKAVLGECAPTTNPTG